MVSGMRNRVDAIFCGLGMHEWKTIYRWKGTGYGFAGFLLGVEWDWVAVGSKCRRCGHEVRL
jgi:hypothetical protein